MAKLTYGQRKKMPASKFAVVEKKKVTNKKTGKTETKTEKRFPIPDKAHARNALARLPQAKGLTKNQEDRVKNAAEKKLYGTTDNTKIAKIKKERAKRKMK